MRKLTAIFLTVTLAAMMFVPSVEARGKCRSAHNPKCQPVPITHPMYPTRPLCMSLNCPPPGK
jgi:hypothetical protein